MTPKPVSRSTRPTPVKAGGQSPRSPSAKPSRSSELAGQHAQAAQAVRIIGGQWKRTPLPVSDMPGLRPTPARVRETLFNWLGQDLTGWRCVDAFAGSGALGLEAASRGAKEVVMVESSAPLVDGLRKTLVRLQASQVRLERGDGLAALQRMAGQGWDVVFLDPPFLQGQNEALFRHALQAASKAISATGRVHLESNRLWSDEELATLGLVALKRGRAGAVHHCLLQGLETASPSAADTPSP